MKRALLVLALLLATGSVEAGGRGHLRRAVMAQGPVCGNGRVQGPETCDDGNATSSDGCSSACATESGFTCSTPGSPCTFDNASSFVFDGSNEFISIEDDASLDFTTNFTVTGWFREPTVATSKRLIAKFNTSNFSFHIGKHVSDPNRFRVFVSSNGTATDFCANNGDPSGVTDNTWYHLAVVYDGSQADNATRLKIYVNGVHAPSTDCTTTIPASMFSGTAKLYIAVSQHSADNYFAGDIDEVTLWNVSLSDANVLLLSGVGKDPRTVNSGTGLVSWYRFGDTVPAGGGTDAADGTLYDKIGSNNGTPTNMEAGDKTSAVPP